MGKLRREYPELDARLRRFVNVGPLRLTQKGALGCGAIGSSQSFFTPPPPPPLYVYHYGLSARNEQGAMIQTIRSARPRPGLMEKIFSHEILSNPTGGRPADARQELQLLTADFEDMREAIR